MATLHDQYELTYVDRYSLEELKVIHHQDREAFVRLVQFIDHDSATRVIAFLKWLELRGFGPVVHRAVSDSDETLYHLAVEAIHCVIFLLSVRATELYIADGFELHCLPKVLYPGFSLAFLAENRDRANTCIDWFVRRVYRRVLSNDTFGDDDNDLSVPPPIDLKLYTQVAGELPGLGSLHLRPDGSGSILIGFFGSAVIELKPVVLLRFSLSL